MATTSFSNWDFYNYHIQQDVKAGQFVSAESTLVAAGPPSITQSAKTQSLNNASVGAVYPIGLLESVGLQQSKQLQRVFEIGSTRSYFIPGRAIGNVSIGRTFYYGPSLLRVLYAYYRNNSNNITFGMGAPGDVVTVDGITLPSPNAQLLDTPLEGLHKLHRTPGEDYFFIEMASDLFAQPTGMAIYFRDANNVNVGAMYLEYCYVQGHQMSISSGSVLIMEGVSLQYDRIVPIKMLPEEGGTLQ
jgi:hypothetical protein